MDNKSVRIIIIYNSGDSNTIIMNPKSEKEPFFKKILSKILTWFTTDK